MSEHRDGWTPGPWIVGEAWPEPNGGYTVEASETQHIADVYAGHHVVDRIDAATGAANARLISAAPDLAAAADEAHAFMSIIMPTSRTADALRIVANLRAALAKARGQS